MLEKGTLNREEKRNRDNVCINLLLELKFAENYF